MSFITGSRAYGFPRDESDTDLVILVTREEVAPLLLLCTEDCSQTVRYGVRDLCVMRFAGLNLLVCTDQKTYGAWHLALRFCLDRVKSNGGPITRDVAVKIHEETFAFCGVGA